MEKLISKKDLMEQVAKFENAIDKFIIVGMFYGLAGESKGGEQLLHIKVSDVDFKSKTISLEDGSVVVMDEYLEKITADAIAQSVYVKIGSVGTGHFDEDYNLNMDSPYIIKTKPTKNNGLGTEPLGDQGLKQRIIKISEFIGVRYSRMILKQSMVFNMLKEANRTWTTSEAERFLKSKGASIRRNKLIEMLKEINGGE